MAAPSCSLMAARDVYKRQFQLFRSIFLHFFQFVIPSHDFVFVNAQTVVRKYFHPLYLPVFAETFTQQADVFFRIAVTGNQYITQPEGVFMFFEPGSGAECLLSLIHISWRGEGSLRAWMERVMVNTVLQYLRKNDVMNQSSALELSLIHIYMGMGGRFDNNRCHRCRMLSVP